MEVHKRNEWNEVYVSDFQKIILSCSYISSIFVKERTVCAYIYTYMDVFTLIHICVVVNI